MVQSTRDRVILLVLPALLLVFAYAYWYHFPAEAELERVQKELTPLRPQADPLILQHRLARAAQLRQEREAVQARIQELQGAWLAMTGSTDDPARRNQRLENLLALLRQNDLLVVEQEPAAGGNAEAPPPALNDVAKRLTNGRNQQPQVWRLRLHGSYASLHRALQSLAEGEPLVIPLGVSMKEAGLDTPVREWTLVVWI